MPIKVIAFEVDNTLWSGFLDSAKIGKSPNAASKVEDNLEMLDALTIRDRSDPSNYISLFPDVPRIVHDIAVRGIKLAIVSRNPSKALCNRALYHYRTNDAQFISKSIISFVAYHEVGIEDTIQTFSKIQGWSRASYDEMVFFDSNPSSREVREKLGIQFELVNKGAGVTWDVYQRALRYDNPVPGDAPIPMGNQPIQAPQTYMPGGQPALGKLLGEGKFAKTYNSADNSSVVIKVMKYWKTDLHHRFLEIYTASRDGRPLHPGSGNDEQYLIMVAVELRNLHAVGQLKAPLPEHFSGWFSMTKIAGTPLWNSPTYHEHPFRGVFKQLVKTAFHLAVDEIEHHVRHSGIEHCDAHLGNVHFMMQGDQPVKANLLDWGIAGRMSYNGGQYLRQEDNAIFHDMKAGQKFTPKEYRRYWISWMVKTEYEAKTSRGIITKSECREFLKNLDWWFTSAS